MAECTLCPRGCKSGAFCKKSDSIRIANYSLHKWEEPCISGTNGAGTIFFSGCNLSCVYCQNHKISHKNFGKDISVDELRGIYDELIQKGAHNIELVTPTHYMDKILLSLTPKLPVPVIYNCSGYESVSALKKLEGYVDIYMPDMKYAFADLAKTLSRAEDYPQKNLLAIEEMYRQVGDVQFDGHGLLKKGVIVRHLILPSQMLNTKAVIKKFAEISKGKKMLFSLMAQYTPIIDLDLSDFPTLQRPITKREYDSAINFLSSFPEIEGYTQQMSSSSEGFIPDFSLGDYK